MQVAWWLIYIRLIQPWGGWKGNFMLELKEMENP